MEGRPADAGFPDGHLRAAVPARSRSRPWRSPGGSLGRGGTRAYGRLRPLRVRRPYRAIRARTSCASLRDNCRPRDVPARAGQRVAQLPALELVGVHVGRPVRCVDEDIRRRAQAERGDRDDRCRTQEDGALDLAVSSRTFPGHRYRAGRPARQGLAACRPEYFAHERASASSARRSTSCPAPGAAEGRA